MASLAARYPRLEAVLDLQPRDASIDDPDIQSGTVTTGTSPSAVYITLGHESESTAAALALTPGFAGDGCPVVVVVADADTSLLAALQGSPAPIPGLDVFSVFARRGLRTTRRVAATEALARAKHEAFVAAELARGHGPDGIAVVPWDQLPEALREVNRAWADAFGRALDAGLYFVVADPFLDPRAAPRTEFDARTVELLATAEHDRWTAELRRDGWDYGPGPTHVERRTHPLLAPWEELDEEDRDRERDTIRDVPRLLAEAGFEVRRLGDVRRVGS